MRGQWIAKDGGRVERIAIGTFVISCGRTVKGQGPIGKGKKMRTKKHGLRRLREKLVPEAKQISSTLIMSCFRQ